jgi:hypothetical protein
VVWKPELCASVTGSGQTLGALCSRAGGRLVRGEVLVSAGTGLSPVRRNTRFCMNCGLTAPAGLTNTLEACKLSQGACKG